MVVWVAYEKQARYSHIVFLHVFGLKKRQYGGYPLSFSELGRTSVWERL
jgi:hypothetical protein